MRMRCVANFAVIAGCLLDNRYAHKHRTEFPSFKKNSVDAKTRNMFTKLFLVLFIFFCKHVNFSGMKFVIIRKHYVNTCHL